MSCYDLLIERYTAKESTSRFAHLKNSALILQFHNLEPAFILIIQSEIEEIQARKARESKSDREVIEFSSASDWLKEWSEFYGPITVRFTAKPTQP